MNYCPNCGNQIQGEFKFCPNCGTKISDINENIDASDIIWNKLKLEKSDFDLFLEHGTGSDIFDDDETNLPIEVLDIQKKLVISNEEFGILQKTLAGNKNIIEYDEYVYIGENLGDIRNGVGALLYFDENEKRYTIHYYGNWKNDKKYGFGIEVNIYYQTPTYIGNWIDDEFHGHGTRFYSNKGKYIGNFSSGFQDGFGVSYHENGMKSYEGNWSNGKEYGSGISYNIFGDILHNGFHDSSIDDEDDDEDYSYFTPQDGAGIR